MMSGTILHGMILTGMTILMSDDLSASCSNAGMMIPTKRRTLLHTHYIHSPIFSRHLATFTSPAKEVGWGDWREGSNPSFSAKKKGTQRVSFFLALFKEKGDSKGTACPQAGKNSSGGGIFSSPGWRRHCPSAAGRIPPSPPKPRERRRSRGYFYIRALYL